MMVARGRTDPGLDGPDVAKLSHKSEIHQELCEPAWSPLFTPIAGSTSTVAG